MTHTVYAFGPFLLDPLTRELRRAGVVEQLPVSTIDCLVHLVRHRNRSVGRDELASAVWGRTDVSEASLTQAIMRLRRVLGDPSWIRTTPRLGYRWTFEATHERAFEPPAASAPDEPAAVPDVPATPARRRRWPAAAAVLVLTTAAAAAGWYWQRTRADAPATAPDAVAVASVPLAAMVVPGEIDASGEWAWLRLGVMDLVANQLRDGGLTTTPSETTLGLINAGRLDAGTLEPAPALTPVATLLVRPHVSRDGGAWNVRLSAHGPSALQRVAEARDPDVLAAARRATDTLLVRLGHTPPLRPDAPDGVDELAQRIAAAGLAGQLDVARAIAARATPQQLAQPEIALSLAYVDFYRGDYPASRARCETLLETIAPDRDAHLRARVVTQLGVIDFREQHYAEAGAAFDQALDLLRFVNDPKARAAAYTGRGGVDVMEGHLDAATAAMGQARLLHEISNDAFGIARVDLNLGAIALYRGQPLAAAALFERTADRFEVLSVPEARDSALRSLAEAYAMLLEHDKALAATGRLGREDAQAPNLRERWWNRLSRAVALAGVGRLDEAEAVLRRLHRDSDPDADAAVRSEADAALAEIAFMRGDYAESAQGGQAALTEALQSANEQDYFGAWFTRIRALQSLGDGAGAAAEQTRLEHWAAATPNDCRSLYLRVLRARQDLIEGHAEAALAGFADALARAERSGIPEDILATASPYAAALVDDGRIEEAAALAGRVAAWADLDMRSGLIAARTYEALGNPDAARRALQQARGLAGERAATLPSR